MLLRPFLDPSCRNLGSDEQTERTDQDYQLGLVRLQQRKKRADRDTYGFFDRLLGSLGLGLVSCGHNVSLGSVCLLYGLAGRFHHLRFRPVHLHLLPSLSELQRVTRLGQCRNYLVK